MNLNTNINKKLSYSSPAIDLVELDNNISLAMESTPAPGPGEPGYVGSVTQEYYNNDPYNSNPV